MKKYTILLLILMLRLDAIACEACKLQQPKGFGGLTHGAGPESKWDYLIVFIMVVITLYVLVATIKCFIKPGEKNKEHIKRMILNDMQP
jgi:heme/copper-type cytochrome/quinol oxidase subunit 2